MLFTINIDMLLLNSSFVVLWNQIRFQSVCTTIFPVTLNLIAVVLKVVRMAV